MYIHICVPYSHSSGTKGFSLAEIIPQKFWYETLCESANSNIPSSWCGNGDTSILTVRAGYESLSSHYDMCDIESSKGHEEWAKARTSKSKSEEHTESHKHAALRATAWSDPANTSLVWCMDIHPVLPCLWQTSTSAHVHGIRNNLSREEDEDGKKNMKWKWNWEKIQHHFILFYAN